MSPTLWQVGARGGSYEDTCVHPSTRLTGRRVRLVSKRKRDMRKRAALYD